MGQKAGRTVAIGIQDFGDLIRKGYFYIDKTDFIREWWESGDSVTLIARPRRFGKTLNMSMVEHFFSPVLCRREGGGVPDRQEKNLPVFGESLRAIFIFEGKRRADRDGPGIF